MAEGGSPAGISVTRPSILDPREVVRILRRHLRIVVAVPLVALTLATLFVMAATPRYKATATVLIDPRRANVMGVTEQSVLRNLGTDDSTVESQVLLIQSASALRRVVDKLNLTKDPDFTPQAGLLTPIKDLLRSASPPGDESDAMNAARTNAVEILRDRVKILRQRSTFLVDINAISKDPAKATRIANAVADSYLFEQVNAKYAVTKVANDWLKNQLDSLKKHVEDSDKAVEDFRAANNLIVAQGVSLDDQQLTDLNTKLIEARTAAAEARAKYEQVKQISDAGGDPGSLSDALSSDIVARLRMQYADLAKSYADLSSKYGSNHPLVAGAKAQMRDTQRLVDQEITRILEARRHTYQVAAARETALEKGLNDVQKSSTDQGQAQVRLRELQRQAEANRTLYESFLARYRETSAQESLELPESRIVTYASVPLRPSFPRIPLTLGLALVLGVGLGVVIALVRDLLDQRVKTLEQLEGLSGIPGIAAIPLVDLREIARKAKRGRHELPNYDRAATRLLPPALQPPLIRYAIDEPTSVLAEAVRAIRFTLQRDARANGTKVVMVTSAMGGEGKTTLAGNLAFSFAASGAKTVLIEGDLRNPEMTRSLCRHAEVGLMEAATGQAPLNQALLSDGVSGLSFLPCPRTGDAQAMTEFIFSHGFEAVLGTLRQYFDVIIIDAPPIVPLVDARVLAEYADGIILSVAWDRTRQEAVTQALDLLAPNYDRILGTVLTGVDLSRLRFYDHYVSGTYLPPYGYGADVARQAAE